MAARHRLLPNSQLLNRFDLNHSSLSLHIHFEQLHDALPIPIKNGARSVTAVATHALLSGNACEKIENSVINKLIVTDTVDIPDEKKIAKIEVVTVANVFAEAIERVYKGKSVSELFEF